MKRYGLIAAIALLIAVNGLVLANVARNRSGAPDTEVTLTERELPIRSWRRSEENTGLSLRVDWDTFDPAMTAKNMRYRRKQARWFDQAKLESIGFDCSRPLTGKNADRYYEKMLSRKTFAVLEYDGKSWQVWREEFEQSIADTAEEVRKGKDTKDGLAELKKQYENAVKTRSRLFVVDVGNDPVQLRQKYPDRSYIITPAKAILSVIYKNQIEGKRREIDHLDGEVTELLIDEINVPLAKRALLDELLKDDTKQIYSFFGYGYTERQRLPYYTVTLRYGKRYEPWIVDIQKIVR